MTYKIHNCSTDVPKAGISSVVDSLAGTVLFPCGASVKGALTPMITTMTASGSYPRDLLDDESLSRRVVARSSEGQFIACISFGALVEGHLLIVPLFGARSMAEATQSKRRSEEFIAFLREIIERLSDTFKRPVCAFEHGVAPLQRHSACGTEHAHLHLLPFEGPLLNVARRCLRPWVRVSDFSFPRQIVESGRDYLMLSESEGLDWHVHPAEGRARLPSQFFRRLIATQLGKDTEWDWSRFPNISTVETTKEVLGTLDLAKEQINLDQHRFVYSSRVPWASE